MFNPTKIESFEKAAENLIRKMGLENYAEIGGKVTTTAGMAAMWPAGSYATNKFVEANEDSLTDAQKKTIRFAGNMAFGAPILYHVMGKDLVEGVKERDWSDATMSGLSLGIGAAGVAYNNREFIASASTLGFLFSLAGEIEDYITDKGKTALEEMKGIFPEKAEYEVGDAQVAHDAIEQGQTITLKKGQIVPVDAEMVGTDAGKFVDAHQILKGDADHHLERAAGETIEQGLKANHNMTLKAVADSEGSYIERMAQDIDKEASYKGHGKIKNIVNKGYVPLMLGVVASQFGLRYYNDRQKHLNRANYKDRIADEAEQQTQDSDTNAFEAQALRQEAEAYRAQKTPGHSFQQSIERSTDLAIKMAPCAIMAALLLYPFVRYRLMSDHKITVNKESGLEYLGEIKDKMKGLFIASDVRGPIISAKDKTFLTPRMFDAKGAEIAAGSPEAQRLLEHHHTLQTNDGHQIAKEAVLHAKENGVALAQGEFKALPTVENAGRGSMGTITHDSEEVTTIAGNRAALHANGFEIPAAVEKQMVDAEKQLADGMNDMYVFASRNAAGETVYGMQPMKAVFVDGAAQAMAATLNGGARVTLASGSNKRLVESARDEILKHTKPEFHSNIEIAFDLHPEEKAKLIAEKANGKGGLFFADDPNDGPGITAIRKAGGHAITIGEPSIGVTKRAASIVVPSIDKVQPLMALGQQLGKNATINTAVAGTYVAGLTGHHLGGTYLYHQERKQRQEMLEQGKSPEEINDIIAANKTGWHTVFEKQPSTVVSSVLHEAPTVAMAGYSGWKSAELLRTAAKLGL